MSVEKKLTLFHSKARSLGSRAHRSAAKANDGIRTRRRNVRSRSQNPGIRAVALITTPRKGAAGTVASGIILAHTSATTESAPAKGEPKDG